MKIVCILATFVLPTLHNHGMALARGKTIRASGQQKFGDGLDDTLDHDHRSLAYEDTTFDTHAVAQWETVFYETFEDGLGVFNADRADHVDVIDSENYVFEGNKALRLRKNGMVKLKDKVDLRRYSALKLSFQIYPRGLESGEGLSIQYSTTDGFDRPGDNDGFQKVRALTEPHLLENGSYQNKTILFGPNQSPECASNAFLPGKNARIRLKLNGSGEQDKVYIDNIRFEGYVVSFCSLYGDL